MRFEFASAGRVVFGPGTIKELPAIAAAWGKRAFVVTGRDRIRRAGVIADLEGTGFTCSIFGVASEPTVQLVREGAELLRSVNAGVVIAIGGGSVIDAGKAIAAIGANPGDVLDYLEVVGKGSPLPAPPVPFIAVPTTAGTGSEVTRNAVLGSPEHGVKASLRSPMMLPRVALADPELTFGLPKNVTAATGMDALTQLIEPFVCLRANPMTDAFCRDGLRLVARHLPRAWEKGRDLESRSAMSYASLLGGLSLANAGLGVVHGFAAPIGGMFDAPHGAICARLLAPGMALNIESGAALERYAEIAAILTGQPDATPNDGVRWVSDLSRRFAIAPLSHYGITTEHIPILAEKAERASSMKANPALLTRKQLEHCLSQAMDPRL